MSKYKVGDKVRTIKDRDCKIGIITDIVEDVSFPYQVRVGDADNYYYSEDMLAPYVEKTYEDGLADAWKVLKHIQSGELSSKEIMDIWGMTDLTFVNCFAQKYTPQEALEILEAYEKSKSIQVGDVIYADDEPDSFGVVTWINEKLVYVMWDDGSCGDETNIDELHKTGRTVDIQHLLEQIRGDD